MLNLQPLFDKQKDLDKHIVEKKQLQGMDLFQDKVLAALVEIGENANEQRSWKHWSTDQKPRTKVGVPKSYWFEGALVVPVDPLPGQIYEYRNPLLEEFVDIVHFFLSIGNGLAVDIEKVSNLPFSKEENITKQYNTLIYLLSNLGVFDDKLFLLHYYYLAFSYLLGLSEMLGFTWEEVEKAYCEKNEINHQRQENGY